MPINPAFHRYAGEAAIIGRIVVAFGELEYMIACAAGKAINQKETFLRLLYRLRNTSSRIDAADALMKAPCIAVGLESEYDAMISATRYCLRIRNQYAHCNWADDQSPARAGLFFTDLRASAEDTDGWEHRWRHIDVPLLQAQEAYFTYTQDWIYFVDEELALRVGKLLNHPWPRPKERERPHEHNPPGQHIPPWLSEDQKALHLARVPAAQGGGPTPTPKQQALDMARAAKRAREQADRDASKRSRLEPPSDRS